MLVLLALFGIHIKMAATMDVSPTNATTTEIIADDDDAWLYGDEGKGNKENVQSDKIEKSDLRETNKTELNGITIKKEDREEGEMSGEEGDSQEKDEDSDDDDDDDDNVQVTIGDIKAWSASEQPRNLFKSGTNYQKTAAGGAPKTTVTTKGLDLEAQGTINGIPVFEFDLSTINNEDKPWRKPGADITDYFNYGFNEDTWQLYCEKQRRLIAMNEGTAPVPKIVTHHTTSASSRAEKESSAGSRRNVTSTTKPVGQIDVIGATAKDSRRPESEGDPIPVAGAAHFTPRKFIPPPGMPPTTLPPPHMPPVDYSIPPPGLPMPHGVPPPGMPGMTVPPPGFPPVPDPYDPFFSVPPPDRSVPPPGFDERQAYGFNAPPQAFSNNAFADASRQGSSHQWETGGSYGERDWERDRERRGDGNRRDRSPHRSEEDFARNEEELHMLQMESLWRDRDRDHDRSRDRERSRERERERERGDRDRSDRRRERDILRSRSHDRDKERERERELERLSRVEEVKHRSRRSSSIRSDSVRSESRKHRDDSDTESVRSSKHKSRRRKREKDDEASESAVEREATKGE